MISEKWFLQHYPEWCNNKDKDMREALEAARNAIRPALFCQDGRLTRCLRLKLIGFLRKRGVGVMAFERDYYGERERTDEFLMELAVIHLARHLIMKRKQEFHVARRWEGYDYVRVYASDSDDARKKSEAHQPPAHGLKHLNDVIDEICEASSPAYIITTSPVSP